MRKIRTLLLAAIFIALSTSVFAEEAVVTFVSGKVEVQRNGQWIALQKGDSVQKSETISTGFQSEVKIKVMDSVMYLGPVTRITLEELSSNGKQDNVNVYLKTGTARSQVKHTDNKRVNYQVHTAVAVASCRGTDWTMDDSNNVFCLDGTVAVSSYDIENPPEMDLGDEDEEDEDTEAESQEGESGEEKVEDGAGDGDSKEADKASEDAKEDSGKSGETSSGSDSNSASTSDAENTNSNTNSNTSSNAGTSTSKSSTSNANRNTNDNKNQNSNKSTKKRDAPTTKDGILVKANQGVKVNTSNEVSAPVNTVERKANEITSAVSTQSDKEAVASASAPKSTAETKDASSETTSVQSEAVKREEAKKSGMVEVNIKLPE